jgi:dolichol kinase
VNVVAGTAVLAAATVALLGLVELVERRWRPHPEIPRKLAHVGGGLIACCAPLLFTTHWAMLFLTGSFALLLLATRRLGLLGSLHPRGRAGAGDLVFPAGLYAAFVLADGDALLFQLSALVLALADPAAALVGQRFGRWRYRLAGVTRSLEGSLGFAATAFAVTVLALVASGRLGAAAALLCASAVAVIVASLEAVSPPGLDNLAVPVGTLLVASAWLP